MVGVVARMHGGSLVDEIAEQRRRVEIERTRDRQRKVRRTILMTVAAVAFVGAATVAGAFAYERYRISTRIEAAPAHLALATPSELQEAVDAMDQNLASAPDDAASLGLLAFVRVHQYATGVIESDEVESALARAEASGSDSAPLARGLYAGLQGDFDEARRAYEATMAQDDRTTVEANDAVWLQAITALGKPYEQDLLTEARAAVKAALERDGSWIPNRRVAAALALRAGEPDEALDEIAEARELAPTHLGLAVDDALFHAASRREVGGVLGVTEQLLVNPELTPRDRAYATLAQGLAKLHQGDDDAEKIIETAWEGLAAWDNNARDLALDALLSAGRSDLAKKLKEQVSFGPVADEIYAAWNDIVEGDTPRALKVLAELPQEHPRVAHLQALALVEQRRWVEAQQWLAYLTEHPAAARPDVEVAAARVQAQTGDAKAALAALEAIADQHPRTHRVWTALAEVHTKLEDSKAAAKAIERAKERETAPAEVWWLDAERLRLESKERPPAGKQALDAFEKAASLNGFVPRYEASLGLYLAEIGRLEQAETTLRKLADAPGVPWEAVLGLADLVSKNAFDRRAPVPEEVEGWLKRSAELAAPIWRQDLSYARYELAQNKPETIAIARARAERVLEMEPRNIEARVILAYAMIEQQDYGGAHGTLERGIQRTLKRVDGPLYIMDARVELARGKERPAASRAYKGWRKLVHDPATPAELLEAAPFVAGLFLGIKQPRPARQIGRELAELVPYEVEAWVFRGRMEFEADETNAGCEAADEAEKLDPDYPGTLALRGDCYVRKFEFASARKAYMAAIEKAAGTPEEREYRRKLKRLQ